MATEEHSVREGTTDDIVFQLLADNNAIDLSGAEHVELELKDSRYTVYRYSTAGVAPALSIYDAVNGKVALTPTSSLFRAVLSPYKGYFLVYEPSGKFYGVPEDTEFRIKVRPNW